jgi:hypothetical protein
MPDLTLDDIKLLRQDGEITDSQIVERLAKEKPLTADLVKSGMQPKDVLDNLLGVPQTVQLSEEEIAKQVVAEEMPNAPKDDVSVKRILAGIAAETAISEGAKVAGTALGAKLGTAGGPTSPVTVPAAATIGYIGGVLSGGVGGSIAAQKIEGQPKISWGRVAADTLLNAFPFGEVKKGPRIVQAISKKIAARPIASKMLLGGVTSPAGLAVQSLVDTGELPGRQQVVATSGLGIVLGGALGITSNQAQKLLGRMANRPPKLIDQMIKDGDAGAVAYVDMLTKNVDPQTLKDSITPSQFKNWILSGELKAKAVPTSIVGKDIAQEIRVGKWRAEAGKDIGSVLLKNVNDAIANSPDPVQAEKFANDYLLGVTQNIPVGMEKMAEQLSLGRKYIRESQEEILANHYSGQKEIPDAMVKKIEDSLNQGDYVTRAYRFFEDGAYVPSEQQYKSLMKRLTQDGLTSEQIDSRTKKFIREYKPPQYEIEQVRRFHGIEPGGLGKSNEAYQKDLKALYTPTNKTIEAFKDKLGNQKMSVEEAAQYITDLNAKKAGTPDEMAQYIFSQNAGVLKNRKDLAPELRDYLGEYADVGSKLGFTVSKLARLASYDTADSKIAQMLFDAGLIKVADETSQNLVPITLRRGEAHLGDQRLVGSPEVQTALNELYGQKADDLAGDLATVSIKDAWQTGTSLSKAAKVVFNPASYVTNFVGSLFSNATMANNPLKGLKMGVKGGFSQFANGPLHSVAGMKTIKDIDYFKELKEVGMMPSSMQFADIQSGLKAGKLGTLTSKIIDPVGKAYSIPDIMARISVYENQKSLLRKAAVGADEKEIHKLAAEMTNNTYMNYDMLNSNLKTLSRNGIPLSQFASFTLELARTQFNQGNIARKMVNGEMAKELSARLGVQVDPNALKKEGVKRILATAAVYGGGAAAITSFNRDSITPEQEKALRETVIQGWDENAPLLIKMDKDGKVYTKNATYLVPQMQVIAPFMSAFRGESMGDALSKMAETAGDGVLENGGFMFKGVSQALANYDNEAQRKITTDPTLYGKIVDQAAWAGKELFEPGFVREAKKAQENPLAVTAMRMGGIRVNVTTKEKGFGFRLREVQSDLDTVKDQLATARYRDTDKTGRLLNKEELGAEYENILNPLYKSHQEKLIKHVKNMRVLGYDNDAIMKMMAKNKVPNLEALNAIDGIVEDLPIVDRKTISDTYENLIKQPGDIYNKILDVAKTDKDSAKALANYHKQQTRDKLLNISERDNAIRKLDDQKQADFIYGEMKRSDSPEALLNQYAKKRVVSQDAYRAILLKMKADKQK